ncbi:MAG: transglutaminase-like domain-containing protein [Phycisphaerae bacterium]|jgi:predicted transglutaminase-like cysteine proteinase|nr:transglutaminase-like domain-containing protein [Phycisphaerae bacterium]
MARKAIAVSCRCLTGLVLGLGAFVNIACVSAKLDSAMRQAAEIRYADDEGGDYWQSPKETIARGTGDCEDQAIYLHHLLLKKGLRSEVTFGVEDLSHLKSGHAWVEYPIEGDAWVLDPTRRLMRLRSNLKKHQYYTALDQKRIRHKLMAYMTRTGASGLNSHYEASIRARLRRKE